VLGVNCCVCGGRVVGGGLWGARVPERGGGLQLLCSACWWHLIRGVGTAVQPEDGGKPYICPCFQFTHLRWWVRCKQGSK